eukprot:Awhi_evm1s7596
MKQDYPCPSFKKDSPNIISVCASTLAFLTLIGLSWFEFSWVPLERQLWVKPGYFGLPCLQMLTNIQSRKTMIKTKVKKLEKTIRERTTQQESKNKSTDEEVEIETASVELNLGSQEFYDFQDDDEENQLETSDT